MPRPDLSLLDIGTGSGCLAITLALNLPGSHVVGWDLSRQALAVAEANRLRLRATNVSFEHCDALDTKTWTPQDRKPFDLIVSNPPYISPSEGLELSSEVSSWEPHLALFSGDDGLDFYRKFAQSAGSLLAPEGRLIVEIGATQGQAVVKIGESFGWREITIVKDYAGHDRVISALRPST